MDHIVRTRPSAHQFLSAVVCTVLLAGLIGCATPGPKPLSVDEIDTFYPQQPAVIALSDPQIYSRESLINDRREEAEFLETLLKDSADTDKVKFEPQIRRDLRMLSAVAAQLQASYVPAAGAQARRDEDLSDLDHQIARADRMTQLAEARARLAEAEARLDAIERGEEPESASAASTDTGAESSESDEEDGDGGEADGGGASGGGSGEDESAGNDSGGAGEAARDLHADLQKIKQILSGLIGEAGVRETDIGATPREDFRDRRAYREELRAARAEVLLDDAHDRGQNSLYRLQFRATVAPGKHASKMGVARLTLDRPEMTDEEILALYKTWLGHVTYRLNQPAGTELETDRSYMALSMGLGNSVFQAIPYPLGAGEEGDERNGEARKLWIALPPAVAEQFAAYLETNLAQVTESCQLLRAWESLDDRFEALHRLLKLGEKPAESLSRLAQKEGMDGDATVRWKIADARATEARHDLNRFQDRRAIVLGDALTLVERLVENVDRRGSRWQRDRLDRATLDQALEKARTKLDSREPCDLAYVRCAIGYVHDELRERLESRVSREQRELSSAIESRLARVDEWANDGDHGSRVAEEELCDARKLLDESCCLAEEMGGDASCRRNLEETDRFDHAFRLDPGTCRPQEAAFRLSSPVLADESDDACREREGEGAAGELTAWDAFHMLEDLAYVEPFFSASIRGLGDTSRLDRAGRIHYVVESVARASQALDHLRRELIRRSPECRTKLAVGSTPEEAFWQVPEAFKRVLRAEHDPRFAAGEAFVYATTPTELAQQLSTTASALRSFEVALALSASLATSGVGASGGLQSLQAAQSSIEARERLPIVVGFSEREPDVTSDASCGQPPCPQFGWLFGPQATIDAHGKRLRLHHPVVNHTVTADLSVPGWWPRVRLTAETAWIGDWHADRLLLRPKKGIDPWNWAEHHPRRQELTVHLPLNRADLDGLTELLAQHTVGGALPYTKITAVSPSAIAPCEKKATILVYGANVWRGTEVYLNGLKADPVRVLPDMAGLSATFDGLDALPRNPDDPTKALLTVWTRDGAASAEVELHHAGPDRSPCKAPSAPPKLRLELVKHVLIGRTGPVVIRAAEGSLPKSYDHMGVGLRPGPDHRWSPSVAETARVEEGTVTSHVDLGPVGISFDHLLDASGTPLDVSLREAPTPFAEPTRHGVDGRVVYYGDEAAASIRVETKKLASIEEPIELVLPKHHDVAFPDVVEGDCRLTVELANRCCPLRVARMEPQAITRDTERMKLFLERAGRPDGACCEKELPLRVIFAKSSSCREKPTIATHEIVIDPKRARSR